MLLFRTFLIFQENKPKLESWRINVHPKIEETAAAKGKKILLVHPDAADKETNRRSGYTAQILTRNAGYFFIFLLLRRGKKL